MLKFRTRIVLALSLVITAGCSTNPVKTQPSEVLAKHVTPGSDVARYLNEGVGHYARGDYERAITKYKTALVIEPTNPIALYELSLAYMSSNKNEKCITTANKAWENSTEITTKLTGILGSCYSQQGNYEKAIELFKTGLKASPANSELHLNIAVTYSKLKRNDEAIHHLKESIKSNPEYASPYLFLAELFRTQNRRVPAITSYMQFVLLEPNTKRSELAANRVFALLSNGPHKTANGKTAMSVNLEPNDDEGAFLALDLGVQVIAMQSATDSSKSLIERKINSLNTLMELCSEMKSERELTSTFTWQYTIKDLLKLQKRSDLNTYAYVLAEKAGSKEAGEFLDRNPALLKRLGKSIARL